MTRTDPTDHKPSSRWKWVSVIVILAILGVVLASNLAGWDLRPFGSTFKSQQPTGAPTPPPAKK